MAFIGPWGQFIHIPKCAGVSMRSWLQQHYRTEGHDEIGMHELPHEITNAFTIIRHPTDWLVSFYTYYQQNGWVWEDLPDFVDAEFEGTKGLFWPQFVRAVVTTNPGAVGRVYDQYCLPGVKVYKLEELYQHFENIRKVHDTNNKVYMSPEQRQMICEAERETLERYGY